MRRASGGVPNRVVRDTVFHIPHHVKFFEQPDDPTAHVKLPPPVSMPSAGGMFVVIVVPPLAKSKGSNPPQIA